MSAPKQDLLRPGQALLSPAWLLGLGLLIVNDHWLKYADLLPGAVTGKLSDVAGMLVAPSLLALLVRARRRAGVAACHVAVGVVFSAIQLSPSCAAAWSWVMGLFGYPWTITCDPSDLLALPVLGLSWMWLLPHMDAARSPRLPLQRSAVVGLSGLGLWASVATTEGPEFEPWYEPVFGNVYIHNANDFEITLFIRPLRESVVFDCPEVNEDPGRLLTSDAFDAAAYWLLPPRTNVAIELGGCDAVWVAGEGIEPTILFLESPLGYPETSFDGSHDDLSELQRAGLALEFGDAGAEWIGGDELRFVPRTDTPEKPASCEAPSNESRIAWSEQVPDRATEILAVELGIDGCFEFELLEYFTSADGPQPSQNQYLWYLCAPASAMPFVPGEFVRFEAVSGSQGTTELDMVLVDPATLDWAVDGNGVPLRVLRLLRGGTDPQFIGPAISRDLEALTADGCPWTIEEGCATAERAVELRVVGAGSPITPGQPIAFADDPVPGARQHTMVLSYARQRAVLDSECSEGAVELRYDIDLALIDEPLL